MLLQGSHNYVPGITVHVFTQVVGDTESSIFGVKPSIPVLWGPGCSLVVAHAEKASHLGSELDSKQYQQRLSLVCVVSVSQGVILWLSALLTFCVCL